MLTGDPALRSIRAQLLAGRAILCLGGRLGGRAFEEVIARLALALPNDEAREIHNLLGTQPLRAAGLARRRLGDRLAVAVREAAGEVAPSETLSRLAELPFKAIVTTGLADLAAALPRTRLRLPGDPPIGDGGRLHLFGDPARPSSLVLGSDELQRGLAAGRYAELREQFHDHSLVLVGFQPDDAELALLFDRILGGAPTVVEHYLVARAPTRAQRDELAAGWQVRVVEQAPESFASDLAAALEATELALPGDDDVAGWLALVDDPALAPVAEWRLAVIERRLGEVGDHDRLIELYLARVDHEPAVLDRLAILFEREVGDHARALTVRLAAYRRGPTLAEWPELERLAAATGEWLELVGELGDSIGELPAGERTQAWLRLAGLYETQLAMTAEAVTASRLALALAPGDREIEARLLGVLERAGDPVALAAALEAQLEVAASGQARAELWCRLAELADGARADRAQAITAYRRALLEDPGSTRADDGLEALLRRHGDRAELARFLEERAQRVEPERARPFRLEAAELFATLGDRRAAIARFEALRADAAPLEVLGALAALYEDDGQLRPAAACVDELCRLVDDRAARAALYRRLAGLWQRLGERGRAEECLEWVLASDPTDGETYRELEALYRAEGNRDAAIDVLQRHARVAAPATRAALWLELGVRSERELDDPGCAIDFYRQAAAELDEPTPALRALARLHDARGELADAMAALDRLTELTDGADRVGLLAHAGDLALRQGDPAAARWFERALAIDPTDVPTRLRLATALATLGRPAQALELCRAGLALGPERTFRLSLVTAAAAAAEQLDETADALALWHEALALAPELAEAAERAAALSQALGRDAEALGLLEHLAAQPADPAVRAARQLGLAQAARRAGHLRRAERGFAAALALAPELAAAARGRAECLHALEDWAAAASALRAVLEAERTTLPERERADLHALAGDALVHAGELAAAEVALAAALVLVPGHAGAIDARIRLLLAHGDRLAGSEPESALGRYRTALALRPDDHRLLLRCVDLLVAARRWPDGLALLERLIATEDDPEVRARYRDVAATILGDELGRPAAAAAMLAAALSEDPSTERAERLEALHRATGDHVALENHLHGRLQALGAPAPGERDLAERRRLWASLADLYLAHDRAGEAATALEVEVHLAPDASDRRARLVELLVEAGPDQFALAIRHHHELLRRAPARLATYLGLVRLYRDTGQPAAAAACARAARLLAATGLGDGTIDGLVLPASGVAPRPRVARRPLGADGWARLVHRDEDRLLSRCLVGALPQVTAARAAALSVPGLGAKDAIDPAARHPFTAAVRAALAALGGSLPELHARPDQAVAVRLAVRRDRRGLVLAFLLGRPLVGEGRGDAELGFVLGRAMACLAPERLLRLLVPDPGELGRVLAVELGSAATPLGQELRARGVEPAAAARSWLRATDATASRAALLVAGDLETAVRLLIAEPDSDATLPRRERVLDLVAWSVSEDCAALERALGLAVEAPARVALPGVAVAS